MLPFVNKKERFFVIFLNMAIPLFLALIVPKIMSMKSYVLQISYEKNNKVEQLLGILPPNRKLIYRNPLSHPPLVKPPNAAHFFRQYFHDTL